MNGMMRGCLVGLLVGAAACGPTGTPVDSGTDLDAGAGDAGSVVDAGTDVDAGAPAGDGGLSIDTVQARAVEGLCNALGRCCDGKSQVEFFRPMTTNMRLPSTLRARLPTDGGVSLTECKTLLGEVYEILPIGSWVRAVKKGLAGFDQAGAQACLDTLDTAACGKPVAAALADGTCFGFGAPLGGTEQRRAFKRTATSGACEGLADGMGALYFGTCDPTKAFCCGVRSDGTCGVVGAGVGECRTAAQPGQVCTLSPLLVCATGSYCDPGVGRCVVENSTPLNQGMACASGFTLLGECVNSWCDFGGTNLCEPLKSAGTACSDGSECFDGECAGGFCAAWSYCTR